MDDDAVMGATMPAGSFRADVQKLIKMCGLTQKWIAEKDLHISTTKMSGAINSDATEWKFFKQVIEICLAKISPGDPPPAMPEGWDVLDYWQDRFNKERQSRRVTEAPVTPEAGPDAPESARPAHLVVPSPLRRATIGTTAVVGIAAVVAGAVLLWGKQEQTGSASEGPSGSVSSSASVMAAGNPWVEVTGTCVGADTQWQVKSSGFTPRGTYTVNVTYPNGKPYPLGGAGDLGTQGTANADGSLKTRWQCYARDPEGTYTMTVRDEATGKTATAKFYVDKPN